MVVCKELKSNIERPVQRKTKEFSNRASCQAGLGPGESQGGAASMSSTKNVHKHETTTPLVSYRVILFVKNMAFSVFEKIICVITVSQEITSVVTKLGWKRSKMLSREANL